MRLTFALLMGVLRVLTCNVRDQGGKSVSTAKSGPGAAIPLTGLG